MAHPTNSDHIILRRATADDASALSSFAARSFQETFGPESKPSDLEAYLTKAFSPAAQAAEIADGAASMAKPSSRAATFTPSPKMSSSSTMTSPRLTPIRSVITLSAGKSELRACRPRWISAAHYAWKLSQYSVAGRLKDTTLVLIDLGIDDLCP